MSFYNRSSLNLPTATDRYEAKIQEVIPFDTVVEATDWRK